MAKTRLELRAIRNIALRRIGSVIKGQLKRPSPPSTVYGLPKPENPEPTWKVFWRNYAQIESQYAVPPAPASETTRDFFNLHTVLALIPGPFPCDGAATPESRHGRITKMKTLRGPPISSALRLCSLQP
jgi:hypothetical protein